MRVCNARAHMYTHTSARELRGAAAASRPLHRRSAATHRHTNCRPAQGAWARVICGSMCKKVAKSLVVCGRFRTFAAMKDQYRYVITGINALTGQREELSGPMDEDAAKARLEREIANRRYQRYQAHKRLRVERRLPVQLTLKFQNYEQN